MNSDIENFISMCKICQQYQRNYQKEVLIPREIPERPRENVGCYFFQLKVHMYIIMIDYFSKYVEVEHIKSNNAQNIKSIFKSVFARNDIHEELKSDDGPLFNSECLRDFLQRVKCNAYNHISTFPKSQWAN